jgi:predicted DNA binding CopG/RHH family protein
MKTKLYNLRIDERTLEAIKQKARNEGLSVSEYIRRRACGDIEEIQFLKKIYEEVKKK